MEDMPLMVSKIEKLILYNQYEILKNLCPDEKEKEYYEDEQKTIMYGSDSDIEETASNFFGTSEEVKEEVYGILEMFRWLECSFKKNNPDQEIPYNIKFDGFDGNEETEHYMYCEYLVNNAHKYEEYLNTDLNSHSNRLGRYKRMLAKYNELVVHKYSLLSSEQIDEIASIR